MFHTTLQATTIQLVFGRDMILNTQFIPDWEDIRRRKQLIDKNDQNEYKKLKLNNYRIYVKLPVYDKKRNNMRSRTKYPE